jgi:hypothetical protein
VTALIALETIVLALLTVFVIGLLRSHAVILRTLHDMGVQLDPSAASEQPINLRPRGDRAREGATSAPAYDLAGTGLRDDALLVPVADVRHRTLLAFLSSGCLTCKTFWESFADQEHLGLPSDIRLVAVTKDAAEESLSTLRGLAPADVPVVMSSDAWRDYDVPGSPYFVLVDDGRVRGEGTGVRWEQVLGLLRQATGDAALELDETNEARIDRELIAHGIRPGDPSLYRSADDIGRDTQP